MAVTDRRTGVRRAAAPGGQVEAPLFVSPTDASPDQPEPPVFVPWAGPVLRLLGVYAVVRVVLLLADVLSAHLDYGGDLNGPLRSWDSHLYLQVAAHGYPAVAPLLNGHYTYSTAAFEPVFPALVAIVTFAHVPSVAAAVAVSMVGGALATVLVWRLALELTDHAGAWRSAVLFAVFPGMGVAWGLLYSECVGLALAAWCLLLMLRRRWLAAGVVGLLATATSPMALPLALAALVPVVQSLRRHQFPGAIATVVLVPLGFLGFAAWLGVRYHDTLYWWHLQRQAWGAAVDVGRSLLSILTHLWSHGYQGPGWLEWFGVLAVAGAGLALWKARLPALVNVYCVGVFFVLFASNSLGFKPRLLTWAFPVLVAVAVKVRGRGWQALVITFAALLPIVFVAYSTLGNTMVQP